MSHENERLCQCGYALGMPGPPQVRFAAVDSDRSMPAVRARTKFVHDLPDAEELVLSVICPCCRAVSYWKTDCLRLRESMEETILGAVLSGPDEDV